MRLFGCLLLASAVACEDVQTTPQPQDSTDPTVDSGVYPDGAVALDDAGVSNPDAAVDAIPPNLTPCEEAVYHSDFTWVQQKIFNVSCDSSHCHGGAMPRAALDLTEGRAYASLVNVQSTVHTSWKRVVPGNPSASILMVRFGDPGPSTQEMPLNQAPLCKEKIDAVRRWIADGALND